ncbi:MAG: hypothetical protein HGA44_22950, partial [Cellulomonadaceae bacterium]|nr:hypothetical protein [Cellulomonadaceae bacterium]
MAFVGAPHGSGSNHANAARPDLPMEPRGKESADDFRRRMEEKAAGRGIRRIPVVTPPVAITPAPAPVAE